MRFETCTTLIKKIDFWKFTSEIYENLQTREIFFSFSGYISPCIPNINNLNVNTNNKLRTIFDVNNAQFRLNIFISTEVGVLLLL